VTRKKRQRMISTPKVVAIVTFTLVAVLSVDFGRKALDNYHIQRQVEWLSQQVAAERETNQAFRRLFSTWRVTPTWRKPPERTWGW